MGKKDQLEDPRGKSSHYLQNTSARFKNKKFEFVPTQFIIDENYVGEPPRVQVGFTNLNDNIDEKFLRKEISKVGQIRTLDIVRHPQTKRHLGLAKVQFEDPNLASKCIDLYHEHMLMGKKLSVFLDVRFTKIEEEKLKLLNPEPKTRNNLVQPKPQTPVPIGYPLAQIPYPPIQIPPPMQPDAARSNSRSSNTTLSLDDRLAKLGLKQQTGIYPPIPQQVQPIQERNTTLQQFHQNHIIARQEKRPEFPTLSGQANFEEDERAWNPEPKPVIKEQIKEEVKEEVKEEINLTDEQILDEVIPYCYDKFIKELQRNLLTTLQRKLIQTYGYPCINDAQEKYRVERDRKELEQRKADQENKNRQREMLAMMRASNMEREKKYIGREVARTYNRQADHVRMRRDDIGSRRINRSAALVESQDQDGRQKSISRSLSDSSRHSRSPDRSSDSDSDSSLASSHSSTSSSSSNKSSASASSLPSSRSPSPSFQFKTETTSTKIKNESSKIFEPIEREDVEAANSLLDLRSQTQVPEKVVIKLEPTVKKRKKKVVEQERTVKKVKTEEGQEPAVPKPVTFPTRSEDLMREMYASLHIDLEDKQYLEKCHELYKEEQDSNERTDVPFGDDQAIALITTEQNEIEAELRKSHHPKWWNGCSRCSIIEISDKGKIEEAVDYDLQKAPIKSHVIQAANSTRRDQRNDQRRIAALNPEIDPQFLKQFTSNTLQMRAKNLRFSRSKIHKWGLFACEKIANGDAVIEYVGEKIRPSVADHREKIIYANLPTHDGSSYFFRVDSDVIDATLKGNKARFINHSCNPNCIAKVIKHENGTNSIVIYAKQAIKEDEEITYDYKFPREETEDKIRCRCGAPNCQKYLN